MDNNFTLRTRFLSRSINLKSLFIISIFIILIICVSIFSLLEGDVEISLYDVFIWAFSQERTEYDFIISNIRLPRIIMAGIVGSLLGISGLILQIIVKNPLSSPDILGISNGASVGVLIFLSYFSNIFSVEYLPIFAILGAFITIFCIFLLSKKLVPQRLILLGIAVSLFMGAIATFLFVFSSSQATLSAYLWLTGSVYGANWDQVRILSYFFLALFPFLLFFSRASNYMMFNDYLITSLGINIFKMRTILLFISVACAGMAVSFAGAISFVGLVSPHIAKKLIEQDFFSLVVLSALVGAMIVIVADLIGRTLFSPLDLPAGIFVSLIGAPFFIYLLIKQFNTNKA